MAIGGGSTARRQSRTALIQGEQSAPHELVILLANPSLIDDICIDFRSYYRCTAQSCDVKKRVERSHQDPTVVITTYEGHHTHHSPVNVWGSTYSSSPSPAMPTNLHHDLLLQQAFPAGYTNPNMHLPRPPTPDYGLLQDIVTSFDHSSQR